jgi:hypothetical protein
MTMDFINHVKETYQKAGISKHFREFRDQFELESSILQEMTSDDFNKILKKAALIAIIMLTPPELFVAGKLDENNTDESDLVSDDELTNSDEFSSCNTENSDACEKTNALKLGMSINYSEVLTDFLFNRGSFFEDLSPTITKEARGILRKIIWPKQVEDLNQSQVTIWWQVHDEKLIEFESLKPSSRELYYRRAGIQHVELNANKKSKHLIYPFFGYYFLKKETSDLNDYAIIKDFIGNDTTVTPRQYQNWIKTYKSFIWDMEKSDR